MQTLQDIHLAIPLLVVPAADVSVECLSLMKYLCKEPFDINCKKSEKIINTTKNYKINPPSSIRVHPLFCETFSDLISYIDVLDKEAYHFYLRNYSIVSFIDYSVNKSIINLEDSFNSFPSIPPGQKAFIIYDSPEKIDNFNPSTPTCLCNHQLTEIESYYYILNFLSSIIVECATNLLENGLNKSNLTPKILREEKVRADFAAVTQDYTELMSQCKTAINSIETKQQPAFIGSFYDLLASYEEVKPGVITENHLAPSAFQIPFKYINQLQFENSMTPPSIIFYMAAAAQYNNAKMYDKCIDVCIKIILSNAKLMKDNEMGSIIETDGDIKLDKNKNSSTSKNLLKSIMNLDYNAADGFKFNDDGIWANTGNDQFTPYSKCIVNPLVDYIKTHPNSSGVLSRAWDLLNCLKSKGSNRKAAVIADQFARVYSKDVSSLFIIFALNLILEGVTADSVIQGRDLCFPMIIELLEHRQNVPKDIFSRFISKIFCTIGPFLNFQQQELLQHELRRCECGASDFGTGSVLMSTSSINSSKLSFLSKASSQFVPDLYEMSKKEESKQSESGIESTEENILMNVFADDVEDEFKQGENEEAPLLPIEIIDVVIDAPTFKINKKVKNESGGGFLFSYLPKKQQEQNIITSPLDTMIIVKYKIRNPYKVTIELSDANTLIDDEAFKTVVSSQFLAANSTSEVISYFAPQTAGTFEIQGYEFSFFNIKQLLKLPRVITVCAVEKVPSFNIKTNLPLSSPLHLYDGEAFDFSLWITNTSSVPITQLEVELFQPHMLTFVSEDNFQLGANFNSNYKMIIFPDSNPDLLSGTESTGKNWPFLPLQPGAKATINCRIVAKMEETYVSLDVRSMNDTSDFFCTQSIRQHFDVIESLKLTRVFLMNDYPMPKDDQEFVNLANVIHVGYEVFNASDSAFQFHAVISGKNEKGVIGPHESVLTTASYNKEDLKTDGSDASKERIISLTKVKEEIIGRSLKSAERIRVAKEVSIMQRFENNWRFNWKFSSCRRGILSSEYVIMNPDLFEMIESNPIVPAIACSLNDSDGETTISLNEFKQFEVYKLALNFGSDLITHCEIDLMTQNPAKSGIMWEGSLARDEKDGCSEFDFVLSFGVAGKFKMILKHISVDGKIGLTPIIVTVS